jgi:hypothetical protein
MPAKWQQWMPFQIDRFKASPSVRAMHPAARIGYLYLLACQWQSADCSIPSDPLTLAEMSELGDELWAAHGPRILRKFEPVNGDGTLRNAVCYGEWLEAKRIFDARRVAADRTNQLRPQTAELDPMEDRAKARKAVTTLVRRGILAPAKEVACFDCGHLGESSPHDWDHYRGYSPENYTAVQSVCRACHHKRETARGKHWESRSPNGHRHGQANGPSRSADTITGTVTETSTGTNTETREEAAPVDPSMFASAVLLECRLAGRNLRLVLEEVARAEQSHGEDLEVMAEQAIKAWAEYGAVKSQLDYQWGAEKFYGDGHWKTPDTWPYSQAKTSKRAELEQERAEMARRVEESLNAE